MAGWGAEMFGGHELGVSLTHALPCVTQIASVKLLYITQGAQLGALWGVSMGSQDGGDTCTHVADFLHGTAETHATWESNYTPIKIKSFQANKKDWKKKTSQVLPAKQQLGF